MHFGLPEIATTDKGNTFISKLWTKLHEELGTIVNYTPVYHPASLGGLERKHRDIKNSLRAALHHMGDQHGRNWLRVLPWTLLGLRCAYQEDLGTSPAELAYGHTPLVPGALAGADLKPDDNLASLLDNLRTKAARPPVQTAHHNDSPPVYQPKDLDQVTHVYVRRGKVSPLGPRFDGPYPIISREGTSCIQVRTAFYANGTPRLELHHWKNCKVANFFNDEPFEAAKPALGRPRKDQASVANVATTVYPYNVDIQTEAETDTRRMQLSNPRPPFAAPPPDNIGPLARPPRTP